MRVIARILIACLIVSLASPMHAKSSKNKDSDDVFQEHFRNTDRLYDGEGAKCSSDFTLTGASMLGWGFLLAASIAILTGTLHQSKAKSSHSH